MSEELQYHINDHESGGATHIPSLGIVKMPEGYALMLNADQSHYYWLRADGAESSIHWNRWAVYRGAKHDKEQTTNTGRE